jgi:molybdate transport system substrate-binding protein
VVLAVLCTTGLAPSSSSAAAGSRLTVFAAADLVFAFKEIVPRFERAAGATVTLTLGSTGRFAQQIDAGAPADVFFAANREFVDDLARTGRVIPETVTIYAQGRIVLATSRRAGPKLTDLRELHDPRIRRIAIANPQHAPYGRAAEQALRSLGLWDVVEDRLIYGENIRHTLQFVQSGAADAGIVALSVAQVPEVDHVLIDTALHEPITQAAAVVTRSKVPALASAFIGFVIGPQGRPIMSQHGFLMPGEF